MNKLRDELAAIVQGYRSTSGNATELVKVVERLERKLAEARLEELFSWHGVLGMNTESPKAVFDAMTTRLAELERQVK